MNSVIDCNGHVFELDESWESYDRACLVRPLAKANHRLERAVDLFV